MIYVCASVVRTHKAVIGLIASHHLPGVLHNGRVGRDRTNVFTCLRCTYVSQSRHAAVVERHVWCTAQCAVCVRSLDSCGLTDNDIPDVVECLNVVGRDNISFL